MQIRRNNFDILRLFAAGLVFYGHSFALFGSTQTLFLSWIHYHSLGIVVFFSVSGYFVAESWDRDPNVLRFLARRSLRIFPGLSICVLLSMFVLGPMLTTKTLSEYFSGTYFYMYARNIFLYTSYPLPGGFETNKLANSVNGSLWSLPLEFFMYIIVMVMGLLRSNRWIWALFGVCSALGAFFWANTTSKIIVIYGTDLRQFFICGSYFWMGAIFYKFDFRKYFSLTTAVTAFIVMVALQQWLNVLAVSAWVLLPLIVLSFGFSYSPRLNQLVRTGDYSYGFYIYAFPVQQTFIYLWPDISFSLYLLTTVVATLFLAILSWHLVEKPALALKPNKRLSSSAANYSNVIIKEVTS